MRPCVILTEPAVSVFEVGFENAWKYLVAGTDKILLNPKCGVCQGVICVVPVQRARF